MIDPQPKTEQPKGQTAPNVVVEPSTTAVPTKPIVAKPNEPAQIPTAKP